MAKKCPEIFKCRLLYLFIFTKKQLRLFVQFGYSFISGVTVSTDCFISYLGDSYCDDTNNFSYCNYDYGDCCLTEKNEITGNSVHNYCQSCLCKSNETGYPSTFGIPPPGHGVTANGPPGQPQGQPPMYYVYY